MKIDIKLSPEQKEIVDGASALLDLGRQALKGGASTIRQAKKTVGTVAGVIDLASSVARAGRAAASRVRTTPDEEDDSEQGGSTIVIDLRHRNGRRDKGDDR